MITKEECIEGSLVRCTMIYMKDGSLQETRKVFQLSWGNDWSNLDGIFNIFLDNILGIGSGTYNIENYHIPTSCSMYIFNDQFPIWSRPTTDPLQDGYISIATFEIVPPSS